VKLESKVVEVAIRYYLLLKLGDDRLKVGEVNEWAGAADGRPADEATQRREQQRGASTRDSGTPCS